MAMTFRGRDAYNEELELGLAIEAILEPENEI